MTLTYTEVVETTGAGRERSLVAVHREGAHAVLTLDDPGRLNPLSAEPEHLLAMSKPLLRHCAEVTWEQAIAMEEFAEPICFTTQAHRDRGAKLLGREA
jgi:2-(1,2-epoxy-1,2-dihydrophenyl)acetyl-CoA isomerase